MAVVAAINGLLVEWLTKSLDISREQLVDHAVLIFRGVQRELTRPIS